MVGFDLDRSSATSAAIMRRRVRCLFSCRALKNIVESARIRAMDEKGIVKLHTLRRLDIAGSSKGDQEKYYDEDRRAYIKLPFYYEGKYWKDYMVEHLSGKRCPFIFT